MSKLEQACQFKHWLPSEVAAIRNMEPAWEKVHGSKFRLMFREVKIGNGAVRRDPCYSLSKTECLYIATNDEARAKLLLLRGCYKPSETWNQHGRKYVGRIFGSHREPSFSLTAEHAKSSTTFIFL